MRRNCFSGLLLVLLGSLAGCHSMPRNVIPESGPAMEEVYDSMGVHHAKANVSAQSSANEKDAPHTQTEADLDGIRNSQTVPALKQSSLSAYAGQNSTFHALPNPELKLYVYPHFAGGDQVPIPGYYTVFNAYEKTYYGLPTDVIR